MVRKLLFSAAAVALMLAAFLVGRTRAQVMIPRPEQVRFEMLRNEPVAMPDSGSVVAGASALVVRDRRSGQCYALIALGDAAGMAPVSCGQ